MLACLLGVVCTTATSVACQMDSLEGERWQAVKDCWSLCKELFVLEVDEEGELVEKLAGEMLAEPLGPTN